VQAHFDQRFKHVKCFSYPRVAPPKHRFYGQSTYRCHDDAHPFKGFAIHLHAGFLQ
jgi:hypothetical protein